MTDGKLLSGQQLNPEETLVSPGGHARLHYQGDGNLVVYLDSVPFWSSHTDGHTAGSLKMRTDGNLVISDATQGIASTLTDNHPGAMVQLQDDGNFVIYEDPKGPQAGTPIWASSTGIFVDGIVPPEPIQVCQRPLVGNLSVESKLFRDVAGFRRVLFCSWFPALRILRDDPQEFTRQIDAIAAAGYQGFRTFLAVGGWSDYWDGREVVPVDFQKWFYTGNHLRTDSYGATLAAWPDYDDLLRTLLRACRDRGLRLHVTTGDMQIICPSSSAELDLHRRFARICAEEGGTEIIALAEVTNEFPINRAGGDSPDSIEQMGRIIDVWNSAIPGVLTAMGAIPQNEEPESLAKASTYGPVCAVHVTRDPASTSMKRSFGLVNWEGDWRAFPKPYWQGEPLGPGADSYQPCNDPAYLVANYAMHAVLGQASVWFQGAAIRSKQPLESEWGFREMPGILGVLPEDVATWNHGSNGRGGVMYFFKGKQFATATCSDWDVSPPQPIASWTLYDGVNVKQGTGTPPRVTGLLVGTFA